ncbi:hypothetical protein [Thermogymnomonas acidicola]|uniref:hypothetical protein n=1 Tax=Thermogymnomonas acidicola TaxID=399579 RepID=UPI001396CC41|nr:hypothetical protein [Thermogymnomonas acidicola]
MAVEMMSEMLENVDFQEFGDLFAKVPGERHGDEGGRGGGDQEEGRGALWRHRRSQGEARHHGEGA